MRKSSLLTTLIICFAVIAALTATGCGRGGSGNNGDVSGSEPSSGNAGSISLEWDPPVDNVDGSPLDNLAGHKIYYGVSSGNYTDSIDVGILTNTTIENLSSGSWCFAATSYNTTGNESDYSNQFCTDI